jgi:hypothetical protein
LARKLLKVKEIQYYIFLIKEKPSCFIFCKKRVKHIKLKNDMKTSPLALYALLLGVLIIGKSNTQSSMIVWNEERDLSWDDFQGTPDYNFDQVSALTSSGILHYKGCENGKIIYKVQAYFEKKDSWVKPEAYTDYHLAHEQIHFDITELYARKLRKALKRREFICGQEAEFDAFVAKFLRKWQQAQIKYDQHSHYSMRPKEQKEWEYLVAMELSMYDKYKHAN